MRTRICWAPNCIFCVRSCHLEAMIEEQALLLRDRMTKVAVAAQCRAPLGCFEPGSSVGWLFDVFLTSLHHSLAMLRLVVDAAVFLLAVFTALDKDAVGPTLATRLPKDHLLIDC